VREDPSGLVDQLVERAQRRFPGPDVKVVEGLLRRYYASVAPDDIEARALDDLYGAALSHWQLARTRRPDEHRLRAYTPSVTQDGWQTPHSVIDIAVDDMPFLVDSVMMAIERRELNVHLLAHPVFDAERSADGILTALAGYGEGEGSPIRESFIHVEFDRVADAVLQGLEAEIGDVLLDVRAAVADWVAMQERATTIVSDLATPIPGVPDGERTEAAALLDYLLDDKFTFLGYREYTLAEDVVSSIDGTGLGLLSRAPASRRSLRDLPGPAAERAAAPVLLNLTKANSASTVHRPERMDYVGVKCFDDDGRVVGERRFVGLYASGLYTAPVRDVPVLRRKVDEILLRCGDLASGHDRAALVAILEAYPRDELFDASIEDLARITEGILHLRERRKVKLFVRRDTFGRYASCLVFVPRDRYNTEVRLRIQETLVDAFEGRSAAFDSQVSGDVLARMHVTVFTDETATVDVDVDALERRIEEITERWQDQLQRALIDRHGEATGLHLYEIYGTAFPVAYRDDHRPAIAVDDIAQLEGLGPERLAVRLYRLPEADDSSLRMKLYRAGGQITLSDVMPLLQDLGVTVRDERPYEVRGASGYRAWIYDFGLHLKLGADARDERGRWFEDAFLAAWSGRAESDGFNHLILTAGLTWREVAVLRAYRRYLRQVGSTFSQGYYEETLRSHPGIVRVLMDLFRARFDPDASGDREVATAACRAALEAALDEVPSPDEDRMLRSFGELIDATVRTSHYQGDDGGPARSVVGFKFDPRAISDLPLPRPAHEIFVYSPAVEGVHLRAGRVARGGIRWSDRREDFRTEILGLVKAQMVKNAVIVPTGAKGGFIPKRLGPFMSPAETREEVIAAYRSFISGLLDLTDNVVDGRVVHPERVVCHDGDDTYLVVAADKGTATFSDLANELAIERGFWLRDAFASGGSSGYDHKAMGITARGAWESVKRHFRELGVDVQTQPFTAVGVGDMSGDVFGNGMLLSPSLRLLAAFDHRDVFIDPDPDPAVSYAERQRLFALPGSSWADYDEALLSEGGGVFSRAAKSIELSEAARTALGLVGVDRVTPNELIRHVLQAPVDLLWNGGVGTFVKASAETHADAGDRACDGIRVDAGELRCKVIGEGGNLGLTQRARVEFARAGGKVFSDAVDNSAGVNCSDHEVNIKILLNGIVDAGDLTMKQRDQLLVEMTDDVAGLVLDENYRQTAALSAARIQAPGMVEVHQRHLAWLERVAGLDRDLEALPTDEELNARRDLDAGLTAPELSVLMAYTKIALYADLLQSDLAEDPEFRRELLTYFPEALQRRYPAAIDGHPLAAELIATLVTNQLVDQAGLSMPHRLAEETSAATADIARAHLAAWRLYDLDRVWDEVSALDNVVAAEVQLLMLLETKRLGERATRWLLRNQPMPLEVSAVVERYAPDVARLRDGMSDMLRGSDERAVRRTLTLVRDEGVPEPLAETVANMGLIITALDIVEIQHRTHAPIEQTAATYFALDDALALGWFRERIVALPRDDRWQSLARSALRDDFFRAHADLTASVLDGATTPDADGAIGNWVAERRREVEHCLSVLYDIRATGRADLAQLSVGLRELRNLLHVARSV
jgi:glutamate dehydrogenase